METELLSLRQEHGTVVVDWLSQAEEELRPAGL